MHRSPAARLRSSLVLGALVVGAALVSACEGCRAPSTPNTDSGSETPTARLYLVSDLAGALEPCGCVKDQLGGMDKLGALVARDRNVAPFATLSAGPLFFMDMALAAEKKTQEIAKAETIASTMKTLQLAAFAPGRNEWAAGPDELKKLAEASSAVPVAANVPSAAKTSVVTVGGITVGVVGVAAPDKAEHAVGPIDVASSPAIPAVKAAVQELQAKGVTAIVVLAAVGRGEAKRIADDNPELLAIVVGTPGSNGDENSKAAPPEQIGSVLVVEAANHLQTVGVLDLYVREAAGKKGLVKFADGTGLERMRRREELDGRIRELRDKIATWENDKSVAPADLAARRADAARLQQERDRLEQSPPPSSGSFYRYAMREIRDELGADPTVKGLMGAYYRKVNEANKTELRDVLPPKAPPGTASYVGIDACSVCHEAARKVWDGTRHAHAYATLEKDFKEANLECVGCHVTGYDKPGGSNVTHVSGLTNVQCEVCHGPGSLHAADPKKAKVPIAHPQADLCISCHHPPHVHEFEAAVKRNEILGPGHGRPGG